jgi:hypothetical protein
MSLAAVRTLTGAGAAAGASSYDALIMSRAPTAYYRLEEGSGTFVADETGNWDGVSNSVTLGVAGKVGNAYALTGSPSRIETTLLGSWNSTTDRSVEFWFKSNSTTAGYIGGTVNTNNSGNPIFQIIAHTGTSTSADLSNGSNRLGVYFRSSTGHVRKSYTAPTASLFDGRWHHIVVVCVGAGPSPIVTLYIDGVSQFLTTETFNPATGTQVNFDHAMMWGCRNVRGTPGGYYECQLDEIAFYPFALTGAQVQESHDFPPFSYMDDLEFWYDAADGSTFTYSTAPSVSVWRDKSGTRRHLQPRTGVTFDVNGSGAAANRNVTLNSLDVVGFRQSAFPRYGCRMRGSGFGEVEPIPFQNDYTVMSVWRWHSSMTADGALVIGFCSTTAVDVLGPLGAMPVTRTGTTNFTQTTHQTDTLASEAFTFGTPVLRTVIKSGTTLSVWEDGSLIATTTVSDHAQAFHRLAVNTDPVSGSSSRCGSFDLAEIKGWSGALSASERAAEESALIAKWGL